MNGLGGATGSRLKSLGLGKPITALGAAGASAGLASRSANFTLTNFLAATDAGPGITVIPWSHLAEIASPILSRVLDRARPSQQSPASIIAQVPSSQITRSSPVALFMLPFARKLLGLPMLIAPCECLCH